MLEVELFEAGNLAVVDPLSSATRDVSRETDPSIRDSGWNPSGPDLTGGAPRLCFRASTRFAWQPPTRPEKPLKRVINTLASSPNCFLRLSAKK